MIAEQDAALAIQQAEMKVKADAKKAEADAAYSIQQETQRKTIEVTRVSAAQRPRPSFSGPPPSFR